MDAIVLIFGLPIAFVIGAALGRWAQRRMWLLHLPYAERVKALRP